MPSTISIPQAAITFLDQHNWHKPEGQSSFSQLGRWPFLHCGWIATRLRLLRQGASLSLPILLLAPILIAVAMEKAKKVLLRLLWHAMTQVRDQNVLRHKGEIKIQFSFWCIFSVIRSIQLVHGVHKRLPPNSTHHQVWSLPFFVQHFSCCGKAYFLSNIFAIWSFFWHW